MKRDRDPKAEKQLLAQDKLSKKQKKDEDDEFQEEEADDESDHEIEDDGIGERLHRRKNKRAQLN